MTEAQDVQVAGAPDASAPKPAVPAHCQSFLALDFGVKRTGVAYGSRMMREAQAQKNRQRRRRCALDLDQPAHR